MHSGTTACHLSFLTFSCLQWLQNCNKIDNNGESYLMEVPRHQNPSVCSWFMLITFWIEDDPSVGVEALGLILHCPCGSGSSVSNVNKNLKIRMHLCSGGSIQNEGAEPWIASQKSWGLGFGHEPETRANKTNLCSKWGVGGCVQSKMELQSHWGQPSKSGLGTGA